LTQAARIAEDGRGLSDLEQARTHFEAGDFAEAHAAAMSGLASAPDDVELLRLAGRAGVETGSEDAVDQLRSVAEQQPDSADSWRDLADALAAEGRTADAEDAFRRVIDIEPEDEVALTALGHTAFQSGNRDEGVSMLEQVAGRSSGASTAAISLVDMYRMVGRPDEALAAARRVAEADPEDALAALDVAELALETDKLDEAGEAFEWLRRIVDLPDDEVGALHGLIRVELARGNSESALDFARQAAAIDTVGRSTGVLAHLEAEAGTESAEDTVVARGQSAAFVMALEAPPSREEIQQLIDATMVDLRRSLAGEARG
jgi:tetratricopeptide (TPR) repeat protein